MQEPADPSPAPAEAPAGASDAAPQPGAPDLAPQAAEPVPEDSTPGADGPDRSSDAAAAEAPQEPARQEMSAAACGARLAERFPALFGADGPVKPIKLRIHIDLQQRAPGEFPRRALSAFLSRHTTSNAYLKALLQAPHRYDLDGQPAGDIDAVHRQAAQQELERRRAARRGPSPGRGPGRGQAGHAGHAGQGDRDGEAATPPPAPDRSAAVPAAGEADPSPGEHAPRARPRPPRGEARPAGARAPQARPDARARGGNAPGRGPAPGRSRDAASPGAGGRAPGHRSAPAAEPFTHAPHTAHASSPPGPGAAATPLDPAQRARLQLVRAWESSRLTQANFCVLMRVTPAELDAAIEQVRRDRPRPDRPR